MRQPFLTYREKDEHGILQYYILQREFPHFDCRIALSPIDKTLVCLPILGYNLWIVHEGSISGRVIPSYKDIVEELKIVMETMSKWYVEHRILMEEKKYQKFKINATSHTR